MCVALPPRSPRPRRSTLPGAAPRPRPGVLVLLVVGLWATPYGRAAAQTVTTIRQLDVGTLYPGSGSTVGVRDARAGVVRVQGPPGQVVSVSFGLPTSLSGAGGPVALSGWTGRSLTEQNTVTENFLPSTTPVMIRVGLDGLADLWMGVTATPEPTASAGSVAGVLQVLLPSAPQASSTVLLSGRVVQGLQVVGMRPLSFGTVLAGLPTTIVPGDPLSGRWSITGAPGAGIQYTLTVPARLLSSATGDTLGVGGWVGRISTGSGTEQFSVVTGERRTTTLSSLASAPATVLDLGATVTPRPRQRSGGYQGLITLTVSYTGL